MRNCTLTVVMGKRERDEALTLAAVTSNVCVCDGESVVGGRDDDCLNCIMMHNGLPPVLEEEVPWT
jgi:hypothetical protein